MKKKNEKKRKRDSAEIEEVDERPTKIQKTMEEGDITSLFRRYTDPTCKESYPTRELSGFDFNDRTEEHNDALKGIREITKELVDVLERYKPHIQNPDISLVHSLKELKDSTKMASKAVKRRRNVRCSLCYTWVDMSTTYFSKDQLTPEDSKKILCEKCEKKVFDKLIQEYVNQTNSNK
jgi:uncharacterized protein YlaI